MIDPRVASLGSRSSEYIRVDAEVRGKLMEIYTEHNAAKATKANVDKIMTVFDGSPNRTFRDLFGTLYQEYAIKGELPSYDHATDSDEFKGAETSEIRIECKPYQVIGTWRGRINTLETERME